MVEMPQHTVFEAAKVYRVREIADIIGSQPRFINREIENGKLRAVKMGGGKRPLVRIKGQDANEWLENHSTRSVNTALESGTDSTSPDGMLTEKRSAVDSVSRSIKVRA